MLVPCGGSISEMAVVLFGLGWLCGLLLGRMRPAGTFCREKKRWRRNNGVGREEVRGFGLETDYKVFSGVCVVICAAVEAKEIGCFCDCCFLCCFLKTCLLWAPGDERFGSVYVSFPCCFFLLDSASIWKEIEVRKAQIVMNNNTSWA